MTIVYLINIAKYILTVCFEPGKNGIRIYFWEKNFV